MLPGTVRWAGHRRGGGRTRAGSVGRACRTQAAQRDGPQRPGSGPAGPAVRHPTHLQRQAAPPAPRAGAHGGHAARHDTGGLAPRDLLRLDVPLHDEPDSQRQPRTARPSGGYSDDLTVAAGRAGAAAARPATPRLARPGHPFGTHSTATNAAPTPPVRDASDATALAPGPG